MPLSRRLLLEGEQVVVEVRPHWSSLGRALPAAVAALALVVAQLAGWPSAPTAVADALLVVLGLAALWLGGRAVRWRATALVLTTARLVQRSGVLARRGLDIRLQRVNEISYHQTILGRVAGTGQLLVETGGEAGLVVFDHVRRPAALAAVVQEQINALHARAAGYEGRRPPAVAVREADDTPPAGVWGLRRGRDHGRPDVAHQSIARQLVELDELRQRGILTEEEFARKKAELLDRM